MAPAKIIGTMAGMKVNGGEGIAIATISAGTDKGVAINKGMAINSGLIISTRITTRNRSMCRRRSTMSRGHPPESASFSR